MATIEVTVPVTVTVDVEGKSVKRFKITGADLYGFGGCFSDCEEAFGVWIPDENAWDTDNEFHRQAQAARNWVRDRLRRER